MNLMYNPTFVADEWVELDITNIAMLEGDHVVTGSVEDTAFIQSQLLFKNIQGVVVHSADFVTIETSRASIVYFTQRPRQLAINKINGNTTIAYSVTM